MIRLIYVSTAESAVNDATISQILVQANRHNDENGITGLMLYNGMNFMQALEGDRAVVLPLMERIHRDPRHSGVIILRHEPIKTRAFPNWSMQLARTQRATNAPARLLDGNALAPDFIPASVPDDVARLFRGFNTLA